MATFAPTLQSDIQPVQVVDTPSRTTGVLGAISGFFPTRAAPNAPSPDEVKKQDKIAFNTALDDARQAREAGDTLAADKLAKDAYRSFARKYGTAETDVNASYQDYSGLPVNVALDPQGSAVADTEIMASPDYQAAVFLAEKNNPKASAEEVHQIAIGTVKAKTANDLAIKQINAQEENNWYDIEKVYTDKAILLGNDLRSMIAAIQKDTIIMPEEAKMLRKAYQDSIGGLQKPAGVSSAKWKEYEDNYIADLTSLVDSAVGLGQEKGISTDVAKALDDMIAIAVSTDKLPPMFGVKFDSTNGRWEDMQALVHSMNDDPKFKEAYDTLLTGTMDDFFNLVSDFENKDISVLDKVNIEPFKALDPTDKRQAILANASALGIGEGEPGKLAVDINDVIKKTELLEEQALQPEDLSRIYSPGFFKAINTVYEANPGIGEELSHRAISAVESQMVNVQKAFVSEGRQLGVTIKDGNVVADITNPKGKRANDFVTKFFGGSWEKAVAAKGIPPGYTSGVGLAGRALAASGIGDFKDINDNISYMKKRTSKFTAVSKQLDLLKQNLPIAQEAPTGAAGGGGGGSKGSGSIGDKFGMDFGAMEAEAGLPPGFLERTAMIESSGNPDAVSSTGATGLFQITKGFAKQYGVTDRNDPVQSTKGTIAGAVDAMNRMGKALGRPPTAAELYLAHQQGIGGAIKLLSNPTAMASDVVGAQAVEVNGGNTSMTAGQFADLWLSKFNNTKTENPTVGTPANANAVAEKAGEAAKRTTDNSPPAIQGIDYVPPTLAYSDQTAAMPTEVKTTEAAPQGETKAKKVVISEDAKALLESIGGADKEYATQEDFNVASDAGELETGDVVLIAGVPHFIRKDGTAVRL